MPSKETAVSDHLGPSPWVGGRVWGQALFLTNKPLVLEADCHRDGKGEKPDLPSARPKAPSLPLSCWG